MSSEYFFGNFKRIFLISAIVFVTGNCLTAKVTMADTKQDLRDAIEESAEDNISKDYYDDFDGDGEKELFAVTGAEEGQNEVWYASNYEVKKVYGGRLAIYSWSPGVCKVDSRQKLIIFESGAFGSSSTSLCYYVKDGQVKQVKKAGEQLTHLSGKNFAVHMGAFDAFSDGTGHTWKAYYVWWTGAGFKEYKGKKISLAKLEKYKGAKQYIAKVKKLGYRINAVFLRENGIINLNLSKKSGGATYNENITLKRKAKKVSLVINNKKGKNIVEKSTYGGKYKATGFR